MIHSALNRSVHIHNGVRQVHTASTITKSKKTTHVIFLSWSHGWVTLCNHSPAPPLRGRTWHPSEEITCGQCRKHLKDIKAALTPEALKKK